MMKKTSNFILIIVVLLLLNLGQFLTYGWNKLSVNTKQLNKGWKTVISERGKFSFDYPTDWPISFISDEDLQSDNENHALAPDEPMKRVDIESIDFNEEWERNAGGKRYGIILVWKQPGIETLDDYVKSVDKEFELFSKGRTIPIPRPKIRYSVIGGEVAVTEIAQGDFATPWSISEVNNYVVVHNGLIYRIYASGNDRFKIDLDNNLAKFNHIISTFKFTDSK